MIPTRDFLKGIIASTLCRELYWTEKTYVSEVTIQEYNKIAEEILKVIDKHG